MRHRAAISLWPAPVLALVIGVTLGLAPAQELFARLGLRPGFAVFAIINVVLPAGLLLLAWRWPRYDAVWFSAILIYAGWLLGAMLRLEPKFWQWTPGLAQRTSSPILLAGAMVCGVLGSGIAGLSRVFRDAHAPGPPDPGEGLCPDCGYSLLGIESNRCPECGRVVPGFANPAEQAGPDSGGGGSVGARLTSTKG